MPAPATGVGLNAAYFSDPSFIDEVLDRVDATLDFRGGVRPTVARAPGIICGDTGAPACGATGDVLGAPALVAARMLQPAGGGAVLVEVRGGGAARSATVTLFERVLVGQPPVAVLQPLGVSATLRSDAADGGAFTMNVALTRGRHELVALQAVPGLTSGPSAALVVNVTDPVAPPPPQVSQPPATGTVSGNGSVAVGGTAVAGATVTVTARPAGGGEARTATFPAGANGSWSGAMALPPGTWELVVTQALAGGAPSDGGAPIKVQVPLPRLTVTVPADGATFTCPPNASRTCPVRVEGLAPTASGNLGPVIVGAGAGDGGSDRAYFVDLTPTLPVGGGGAFGGTLALDYGRHQLKIFQRANGLDGEGVLRTVLVTPPVGALAITELVSGAESIPVPPPPARATVNAAVLVKWAGGLPRTGLPGTVIVYQGSTRLGEGPLDDLGGFEVPVTLSGAGIQRLSVSQTARSLTGGGCRREPAGDHQRAGAPRRAGYRGAGRRLRAAGLPGVRCPRPGRAGRDGGHHRHHHHADGSGAPDGDRPRRSGGRRDPGASRRASRPCPPAPTA